MSNIIDEFLECIEQYGVDECEEIYAGLIDKRLVSKIRECMDKCLCCDDEIQGVTPEYDGFCKNNCVCIEW